MLRRYGFTFITTKISSKRPLRCAMHLMALCLLLTGNQAWAHDDRVNVTGFYDAIFTRIDFLSGVDDVILDATLQGPFELNIGGVVRTGMFTFSHIANLEPDFLAGSANGGASWVFNDGLTCVGLLGGKLVPPLMGFVGEGRFECSDGTILNVDVVDTDLVSGVSTHAEVNGKLITHEGKKSKKDKKSKKSKDD